MAEGCISVVEMTVAPCFVQQHAGRWVMLEGKNCPGSMCRRRGRGRAKSARLAMRPPFSSTGAPERLLRRSGWQIYLPGVLDVRYFSAWYVGHRQGLGWEHVDSAVTVIHF